MCISGLSEWQYILIACCASGLIMTALAHTYHYLQPSMLEASKESLRLRLASSGPGASGLVAHPYFFEGRLLQPRLCAELLSAVHRVVASRFFVPPNTLARMLALADPVVTAGGSLLRFDGFSGCCSCYVRVDLLPEIYEGEVVGKGTTNVDFNEPMRAALARVRDADVLSLSVGQDALSLRTGAHEVVERKVALPQRWLRGMLEVQSYLASMSRCFEVKALEAIRFLRSLPKASTSRTPLWVLSHGAGLMCTTREQPAGVRVTETSRLRVLEALLPKAQRLSVYSDDAKQSSAWVLDFPGARLTLALSAETWRGFSGEGQALRALLRLSGDAAVSKVRAQLNWQSQLVVDDLAAMLKLPKADVADSLRVLGASGLAGFDLTQGCYFHRVLPLDLSLVEEMHPRLADARALVAAGAVVVEAVAPLQASVSGKDAVHRVREVEGVLHCTCPWFAKFQGERGPCKHVLAVEASRMKHLERK